MNEWVLKHQKTQRNHQIQQQFLNMMPTTQINLAIVLDKWTAVLTTKVVAAVAKAMMTINQNQTKVEAASSPAIDLVKWKKGLTAVRAVTKMLTIQKATEAARVAVPMPTWVSEMAWMMRQAA